MGTLACSGTSGVSPISAAQCEVTVCLSLFSPQVFTKYGKCYMFNSGEDGKPLLTTVKGGTGNGLEIMLDIQQDEYLPIWGETGELGPGTRALGGGEGADLVQKSWCGPAGRSWPALEGLLSSEGLATRWRVVKMSLAWERCPGSPRTSLGGGGADDGKTREVRWDEGGEVLERRPPRTVWLGRRVA